MLANKIYHRHIPTSFIQEFYFYKCVTLIFILFILFGCESEEHKGERLAKSYCASCHKFPEPSLLTKAIWQNKVLPNMALRMGMLDLMEATQSTNPDDLFAVVGTLPAKPMVSDNQWESIVAYFLRTAPDSLEYSKKNNLPIAQLFESISYHEDEGLVPLVTLIKFDSISHHLFLSNRKGILDELSADLKKITSHQFSSPASHLIRVKDDYLISLMGIMDPNDQPKGEVIKLTADTKFEPLIDSLKRPVYFETADLNNDQLNDIVVCAFGNYTGSLSVYEKTSNLKYKKHIISTLPGSRRTLIKDFNGDGLPDILALFTQGDEQITLFFNKGDFTFDQKILLRFPPVYGSSYFDIADFNKDGRYDILYTNGDNSDYSQILKPYHGVRIFLQNNLGEFKESWFYQQHGASKALAFDFDLDGDLDIASISFFPDFEHNPEEGFLYFENVSGQFVAHTIQAASAGRWLVMETADLEGDGDKDILLGALDFTSKVPTKLLQQWKTDRTSVLVLKNLTVK